jgi:hypothetical protein
MITIDLTKTIFASDRVELRSQLINIFLKEQPGTGRNELTSRYRYVTKILSNNKEVYLSRPANFNNGFDFTLNVKNVNFNNGIEGSRATTRPTHGNILDDLNSKYDENIQLYNKLIEQITLIYSCIEPTQTNFEFKSGYSTELLLECIKWLFVEQDVTYWNYSGRAMFYEAIMDS